MADLAEIADLVDALQATDLAALPDAVLCEQTEQLRTAIDRLEAEFTRRTAAIHVRGAAAGTGAASTASWLRGTCHLAPGAARDRIRVAETCRAFPALATAAAAGDLPLPHASVLAKALESLPESCHADVAPFLLQAAGQLDPAQLATLVRRVRYAVDPDGARGRDQTHHERRWLDVARTFEGLVSLTGLLDADAGSVLLTALDPLTRPTGLDDTRTASQRRADALTDIARHALDSGELPRSGGDRPHLTVTIDWATLRDAATAGGTGPLPGAGPTRGTGFAEAAWTGPLGPETARRLACDAAITRVIMPDATPATATFAPDVLPRLLTDPPSQPLDIGRTTRAIPPPIRRALAARDRGCTFPNCDRPPGWCDSHHIIHWANGGPTALENLTLLCRHHHTYVHETGWTITMNTGRAHFTPPDTAARNRGSPTGHAA